MNDLSPNSAPLATPSRRGFLAGVGGLAFAISIPLNLDPARAQARAAGNQVPPNGDGQITGWVHILSDGTVEIAAPAAEMGQGVMTALPMIFAEELDVPWEKVRPFFPVQDARVFGNPAWGGTLFTVGSKTVQGYWDKLRLQAASIRRVLIDAAAAQWNVPAGEITTEPGTLVHAASNRRMSYGDIARTAQVPAEMPKVEVSDLKKFGGYRVIGTPTLRVDMQPKSDGSAKFGIDVNVPGMVYATVLRAPQEGAKADKVDDSRAKTVAGVQQIIKLPTGAVGIVGDSIPAVFAARGLLDVTWSDASKAKGYDSDKGMGEFLARAKKLDDKGVPYVKTGDAPGAIGSASNRVGADYSTEYVYHAQMEPMNITASVNEAGNGAEIWMGTQAPSATISAASAFLKGKPEDIVLHQHFLGGGYGRRGQVDTVPDVLALSKAVKKPVKLVWTREQDVKSAKMRPMYAHHLEAGFDANGKMTSWHHRIVAESVVALREEAALERLHGLDNIVLEGAKISYGVPNQLIEYVREQRGVALCSWRGIGAGPNKFAIESFIDDCAHARNQDPLDFRLAMLADNPRAKAVLRKVKDMSGWGKKPAEGHALGLAFGQIVDSWTAGVVEISVDRQTGEIRAHNFWLAIDPGVVINPDTVLQQCEGNVIFGLSQTLKERVSVRDGEVQESNYYDYPVLRMAEMPEIHVEILATDNPPTGMGEAALPLVAPAISNAFLTLTGKRLDALPFTPERVKSAFTTT